MSAPLRQEWFSAAELAGLPGVPRGPREIRRRAESEGWETREAPGRGTARKLYSVDSLPPEARAELAHREAAAEAERNARLGIAQDATAEHYRQIREAQAAASVQVAPHAQRRAEARAAILRACEAFRAASPTLRKRAANEAFATAFNAGQIPVDTRGVRIERISAATLFRWEKQARDSWQALGGSYGGRAGQTRIDAHPEWVTDILGILAEHPSVRVRHVREALVARRGAEGMASETAIADWIRRWQRRNPGIWADLQNPDAARGRHMPAVGSQSERVTRLNQLWMLDSTPTDILLADGRRRTIVAAVDVYSRRMCCVLAASSSSREVGQVLRAAILRWGVPEAVLTDNGADYVSHQTRAFLGALEIRHEQTLAYRGDLKAIVERAFRTLQHDLVELLPGYCGHTVAEGQAIRSRRTFARRLGVADAEIFRADLSPEEFTEFLQRWCQAYEARPHSGIEGATPRQMAESWPGEVRRIQDERALDVLLQPIAKPHTVNKKGLRIDKAWFASLSGELGSRVGEQVQIRRDPADVGRVWVFETDGRYICTAVCPERTGVSRAELAAKASANYREALQAGRAMLREARRQANTSQLAEEILAERLSSAGVGVVVPMRPPVEATVEHTTTALDGATDLLAAQAAQPEAMPSESVEAGRAALRDMEAARTRQRELIERGREAERTAAERWVAIADSGLDGLSAEEVARWKRMAVRDPGVFHHVRKHRPDLLPLLARAEEELA